MSLAGRKPTARTRCAAIPTGPSIDPTSLPKEYGLVVEGDCLSSSIASGTVVVVSNERPRSGDLAVIWLRGHPQALLKRLVLGQMPGVTFPYVQNTTSEIAPFIVVAMTNPPQQYRIRCVDILALHRCIGPVPEGVELDTSEIASAGVSSGTTARQRALNLAELAAAEPNPERRRELEQSALRKWQEARRFSRLKIERRFVACDQCNGAGWFVGVNGQLHTCVVCNGAGECRR
jgi:hypothetical protein